jgi:hypothetical protein
MFSYLFIPSFCLKIQFFFSFFLIGWQHSYQKVGLENVVMTFRKGGAGVGGCVYMFLSLSLSLSRSFARSLSLSLSLFLSFSFALSSKMLLISRLVVNMWNCSNCVKCRDITEASWSEYRRLLFILFSFCRKIGISTYYEMVNREVRYNLLGMGV